MTSNITAIYENGVLRPLQPLVGVPDKSEVDITVNTRDPKTSGLPSSTKSWKSCIGTISDADAADMTRAVKDEFEKVDQRDW